MRNLDREQGLERIEIGKNWETSLPPMSVVHIYDYVKMHKGFWLNKKLILADAVFTYLNQFKRKISKEEIERLFEIEFIARNPDGTFTVSIKFRGKK